MSAYIKRISDGRILHSCSSQTVVKDLVPLQNFITSRGWGIADFVIADGTDDEIKALIASAKTPTEVWEEAMAGTDAIPRWSEDIFDALPLEIRDVVNPVTKKMINDKKALREIKPV